MHPVRKVRVLPWSMAVVMCAALVLVALSGLAAPGASAAGPAPSRPAAPPAPPAPPTPPAPPVTWDRYMVRSAATGKIERFWVGRPASLKPDGKYPTVYFLPGLLDTEDHWKAALDPHLGRYEMVAVCPSVGGATWFLNSPRQPWMKWGDFLTEELRTFVESSYPAAPEKGQRGIIGISAGGNAALYHALKRPELYGAVAVFSGAIELRAYAGQTGLDYWIGPRTADALPLYEERSALALIGQQAAPLPFDLSLDAGDKDGALEQMKMLRQALDLKKIAYKWNVGPGSHDWAYWKSRTPDHLAWFAEAFAANRRDGRFPQKPAASSAAKLEPVKALPDVALSSGAAERLGGAWTDEGGLRIDVSGLTAQGAPLATNDPKYKEVKLAAPLDARGHEKGLWLYRLSLAVSTPLTKEGTITLRGRIANGRGQTVLGIPETALAVPAGEPNRRVELRARLALEIEDPDALRGGMVCALQPLDAEGKPVGSPVLAKAQPGSAALEWWPLAPEARAEFTLSLKGAKALGLAAVYDARLVSESGGK